jgi:hypothetical protein
LAFDIYLFTAIGFHKVTVDGRIVQKQETDSKKGEKINKTIKSTETQYIKYKTKIKNKNNHHKQEHKQIGRVIIK